MKELVIAEGKTADDYLKELENFLGDPTSKRCVLTAQGRNINVLVDVAVILRSRNAKRIKIDDITIGTVKGLPVKANDYPKNLSTMKIVVVKIETFKE
jgi:DNA-binding protein Alba